MVFFVVRLSITLSYIVGSEVIKKASLAIGEVASGRSKALTILVVFDQVDYLLELVALVLLEKEGSFVL